MRSGPVVRGQGMTVFASIVSHGIVSCSKKGIFLPEWGKGMLLKKNHH